MSKLDIQIEFDGCNRAYRGGDEVSGTVTVTANTDVKCRALTLEYYWKTHGRGNKDTGRVGTIQLVKEDTDWIAGDTGRYPFRFTAPAGPATYHGHFLNIDHYVKVRADVPWGFDPKVEEEFIVVPGDVPDDGKHVEEIGKHENPTGSVAKMGRYGIAGGIGLICLGLLCLFPFGLVLIPAGLFVIWLSVRNILAEKKLGKVRLDLGEGRLTPGDTIPLELEFSPSKQVTLNGITATLTCVERCTSGSGTSATTHKHPLVDETFSLTDRRQVDAQSPVRLCEEIPIPKINAFSFKASDNHLRWHIAVRIDIPKWPDWTQDQEILVVPKLGVAIAKVVHDQPEVVAASAPPTLDSEPEIDLPVAAAVEESDFAAATAEAEPTSHAMQSPALDEAIQKSSSDGPPTLQEVCAQIKDSRSLGDERTALLDRHRATEFECDMKIDRINETFGYVGDPKYGQGKTVVGYLAGTTQAVMIMVADSDIQRVADLGTGHQWQATCRLVQWDHLYDRAVLHAV